MFRRIIQFSFFVYSSILGIGFVSCNQVQANPPETKKENSGTPATQTSPSTPVAQSTTKPIAPPAPQLPPPSQAQIQDAQSISRTFAQVAEQLRPSVVSIKVEKLVRKRPMVIPFGFPFGSPDEEEEGQGNPFSDRKQVQKGAGSGFVIDERGYIVTNNHVAGDASKILVSFADQQEEFEASVVGTDPQTDLAVIKINDLKGYKLKAAKLGDSEKLQVAEWVMAIGNPFGLDHTVTVGVISAKGRQNVTDAKTRFQEFLQTDASINPGNSGGPLINLNGEVIGINTAIYGPGGNIGIGFAIPSNLAKPVVQELIEKGKIVRSYLGIAMKDLTTREVEFYKNAVHVDAHVKVAQVSKSSPADQAHIYPGDILLSLDNVPIKSGRDIQKYVLTKQPKTKIKVSLLGRDGKLRSTIVETAEFPSEPTNKEGKETIPFPGQPLPQENE